MSDLYHVLLDLGTGDYHFSAIDYHIVYVTSAMFTKHSRTLKLFRGGAGGVLDHESRGKKIPFHSFTMKVKTFHVSRRKTRANSTMTCIKLLTNIP